MIFPTTLEEVVQLIEDGKPTVFLFVTTWCGDCRYIKPHLPAIEAEFPDLTFVQLDRDDFMSLAQQWAILGIPSLVVLKNGQEIGRFVDKNRKTKEEIINFLTGLDM
ncbi:thioredoxin family protein [Streptococcus ruminantium]|uniref:thioredoxin family protein n=1 Tax=Streptococcus ruminantium TaxID=1917441 RepID=UPI0012DC4152|nr:thioredoxin family protein [Streptococcus ruminantium]